MFSRSISSETRGRRKRAAADLARVPPGVAQDAADDPEAQLSSEIIGRPRQRGLELTGAKDAGAPIDVRGHIMQMILAAVALVSGHLRGLAGWRGGAYMKPKVCAIREETLKAGAML
jgi:hypothetical protein